MFDHTTDEMGGSRGNVGLHPSPQVHLLVESRKVTDWQAHSVRGFLSTARKKHSIKIKSSKNEAGERVYKIAK
jgi:hypothetical protein